MLRDAMLKRAMNQSQLARDTGLSRTYINDIMRGRTPISARAALRFEYVLGVSAQQLLAAQNEDALEAARK